MSQNLVQLFSRQKNKKKSLNVTLISFIFRKLIVDRKFVNKRFYS